MSTDPTKTARTRELEALATLPEMEAALPDEHGVLLSDQIERCAREFELISPFRPEQQLKPASYRLTVGDRYALAGQTHTLGEGEEIKIEPFQVVVIQTLERLNLPRNMIARWNIKVSQAYKGLIWAGGPQVDPGYKGHLFCPIYNLSDRAVTLHHGDQIAVIDFTKTTAFREGCKKFPRPPASVLLEDYGTDLDSALYALATGRMKAVEDKVKGMEVTFGLFVAITFAVMGVLVAALSVKPEKPAFSSFFTLLALAALALSLIGLLKGTAMSRADLKAWWRIILFFLVSAAFGGACWWLVMRCCWPLW
jgi:deoxycytidine triphosphate deaminase